MSTTSSLELAVLGLLKEGAMHGYELSKRLRFTLGPLYTVSYGSLYPCLKRLGVAGMVRERVAEEEPPPKPRRARKVIAAEVRSTRGTTRRARKVYEITPEGETFFFQQLEQGAVYDTDRFQTRFAFFRYLPKEMRIRLLEHRKAYLEEKLEEFDETLRATRERMDAYSRSLIDHSVETTQTDIRWLQGLIDEERRTTQDSATSSGIKKERRTTHGSAAFSGIKEERRTTHGSAAFSGIKEERATDEGAPPAAMKTKKKRKVGDGDVPVRKTRDRAREGEPRAKRGGKS